MDEDTFLEDRLYPWLANDCMADETTEEYPGGCYDEAFYCDGCDAQIGEYDEVCAECGTQV